MKHERQPKLYLYIKTNEEMPGNMRDQNDRRRRHRELAYEFVQVEERITRVKRARAAKRCDSRSRREGELRRRARVESALAPPASGSQRCAPALRWQPRPPHSLRARKHMSDEREHSVGLNTSKCGAMQRRMQKSGDGAWRPLVAEWHSKANQRAGGSVREGGSLHTRH